MEHQQTGSRPVGSFLAMRHRQYQATMAWKVLAQRAEYSLTENVASPFQAEPRQVEVGLAGREGFVGLPVIAGFRSSASRAVTQAEGSAFRINADDMRKALRACPQLNASLVRYSQEATMEVTQIAACNRLHEVEERLARWLLMSQDRIRSNELPLTQEFLSQILGTRRSSVSVAVATLQGAGLIRYTRGHVSILNQAGWRMPVASATRRSNNS